MCVGKNENYIYYGFYRDTDTYYSYPVSSNMGINFQHIVFIPTQSSYITTIGIKLSTIRIVFASSPDIYPKVVNISF